MVSISSVLFYENSSQISFSMMELSNRNDPLLWQANYSRLQTDLNIRGEES